MHEDVAPTEPVIRRRGVVAVVMRERRFLAIRRSATVVAPLMFCFPGGGIEEGETEAAALEREMEEELGIAIQPVDCIWRSITAWGTALAWWRAEVSSEAILVPNPLEVESIHWLSREELLGQADLLDSNRNFLEVWGDERLNVRS